MDRLRMKERKESKADAQGSNLGVWGVVVPPTEIEKRGKIRFKGRALFWTGCISGA